MARHCGLERFFVCRVDDKQSGGRIMGRRNLFVAVGDKQVFCIEKVERGRITSQRIYQVSEDADIMGPFE